MEISERAPRERSEWGSWPGCLIHKNDIGDEVKQFILHTQESIFPREESFTSKLEEIICCCGHRPNQRMTIARFFGHTAGK